MILPVCTPAAVAPAVQHVVKMGAHQAQERPQGVVMKAVSHTTHPTNRLLLLQVSNIDFFSTTILSDDQFMTETNVIFFL